MDCSHAKTDLMFCVLVACVNLQKKGISEPESTASTKRRMYRNAVHAQNKPMDVNIQYLRQLSGLDFSAWAMNTTHWHQMFSDISNKKSDPVFADVFFNISCKYFTMNSVPWGQDTKQGVFILVSLVKGNQGRLSLEM